MFGYITIQKPELKIREFTSISGSYYCGLCRSLRLRYGLKGSLALNYDMVFLAALLTGLYEGKRAGSHAPLRASPVWKAPVIVQRVCGLCGRHDDPSGIP